MAIEIIVPRLGWSMDEGTFCRWLKQEGEQVREGDELFELEGDKATQVVESFDAGILRVALDGPQSGDAVKVGQVLGHLHPKAGDASSMSAGHPTKPAAAEKPAAVAIPSAPPVPPSEMTPSTAIASPSVRRLARQLHVELQSLAQTSGIPVSASEVLRATDHPPSSHSRDRRPVTPRAARLAAELGVSIPDVLGTGKNGRVRERDVRGAAATSAATSAGRVEPAALHQATNKIGQPISAIRRVIAERMMAASHQAAPVTLTAQADASELAAFREECKRTQPDRGLRAPSYADLFVKLSAAAIEKHPSCLAQWIDDSIVVPERIDVSVAIDTPQGLVTPVVRDVPSLSLRALSEQLAKLIELARSRQLSAEQMQGGVFTVSSLGGSRVEAFTPILNPPQTAILGAGRIAPAPVVRDGQVAIRQMVMLSLTFDHRIVDGAPAAALLTTLCEVIESPLPWLLA